MCLHGVLIYDGFGSVGPLILGGSIRTDSLDYDPSGMVCGTLLALDDY